MANTQTLTNEEILDELLNINIPGITQSLVEVFGEEYKGQIDQTLTNTTFYAIGNNSDIITAIQSHISNLKNWFNNLPQREQDKHNDYVQNRISKLNSIYDLIISKTIKIEKNEELTKAELNAKLNYCEDHLSLSTRANLRKKPNFRQTLKSIITTGYDLLSPYDPSAPSHECEYYLSQLKQLLDCSTPTELLEHPDFKLICKCAEDAEILLKRQQSFMIENTPTIKASIERMKKSGFVSNTFTDNIIYDIFFTAENHSRGLTRNGINKQGEPTSIISIKLNQFTDDQVIFHEIVHALTAKLVSNFIASGFLNCDGHNGFRYVNEIVTDWLAKLATDIYLKKFAPAFGAETHSGYFVCYQIINKFLENYKDEIITAIMSDNPIEFLEKLGKDYCYKANDIFEATIHAPYPYNISDDDMKFLNKLNTLEKQLF